MSLLAASLSLSWLFHSQPLTGELVLTDIHAIILPTLPTLQAYATGEGGVLLKLLAPLSLPANATPWRTSLDASFPLYFYGVYTWPEAPNATLVSGFFDGNGRSFGILQYTADGGATWANETILDAQSWGGGPIEFAGEEGLMQSTAGGKMWRTSTGGRRARDWAPVVPNADNWHSGDFVWDGDGYAAVAGSDFCNSTDYGSSWRCFPAFDASGMDGGIACSDPAPGAGVCITGGGEISPAVSGWVHLSRDGGRSWGPRALTAAFPIRTLLAVPAAQAGAPTLLLAAGGNYFSSAGGVYASLDEGATWQLSLDLGQEVKACRAVKLPTGRTRIFCVSAGQRGGSIVSCDY